MPAVHYQLDRVADQHMRSMRAEIIENAPVEAPSDHRFRATARSIARRPDPDGLIRFDGYEFQNAEDLEVYLDNVAVEAVESLMMRDLIKGVHEAAEAVVAAQPGLA